MSIKSELRKLVEKEILWCVEPFEGDPPTRTILISSELNSFFAAASQVSRIGELWASLLGLVAGGEVSLSFVPFKHKNATFGLLDPVDEGTWEYRSVAPSPGLRLFGRFTGDDTFVGIDWWPRSKSLEGYDKTPLGKRDSIEYLWALGSVEAFWKKHLAHIAPVLGDSRSEYFSTKCSDAGAKW